ncbi:MAG: YjbH domain-containing protein [Ectothiorhodospiraceae bacterium]|nr:YjbH domain-containing protein [Ectothiorhodospiraceae bacterium]
MGYVNNLLVICLAFTLLISMAEVLAGPTVMGQTGLIAMPSARVDDDGSLRFGLSDYNPYTTFWSSLGLFPRLELGARYTAVDDTVGIPGTNFGTFKDKAFDIKLMLIKEGAYLPALSIGSQDFLGTRVFDADYVVMSKAFGPLDASVGYGRGRIDGYFGGLEYQPEWANGFGFIYEYDAIDYPNERFADTSGAIDNQGGSSYGVNYKIGWLGLNAVYQRGRDLGVNAYIAIPLMAREFIPKLDEPPVFNEVSKRSTVAQWFADSENNAKLVSALEMQGFKNVQILLVSDQLDIGFAHPKISLMARAVGRVARTALLLGPTDISSIQITYFTLTDLALVTYQFTDLTQLDAFFAGKVTYGELLAGLTVSYAEPATAQRLAEVVIEPKNSVGKADPKKSTQFQWVPNEDGQAISLKKEETSLGNFRITPINAGIYFNDANGAFRYETFALARYSRYLRRGLFFKSGVRVRLFEDISKVVDKSNSNLPHVRTDIADYKRDADFKVDSLLVNQFMQLRPRVYARASVGYYEEMFGGAGGQVLYLPKQGAWAVDFSLDFLRQRKTNEGLGFRPYTTTTAIAAFHYQIPKHGLTFTVRGGRFLAKDVGLRYEFQRRFRSGVRIGVWYTVTDGNDITKPGSPGDPYRDKGIMLSIPLGSMLTRDTRATARFAISPWTRDVGQAVKSPGDLYNILEDPLLLDSSEHHLLSEFHY